MAELERQVRRWCRDALPQACADPSQLAELEDHLLCEIERLEEEGLSPAAAFEQATRRMGEARSIMQEYAKNQTLAGRLCALDSRLSRGAAGGALPFRRQARRLILGHSMLWAAALLASALLARDSASAGYLVVPVMVSLWLASYLLIQRSLGALAGTTPRGD